MLMERFSIGGFWLLWFYFAKNSWKLQSFSQTWLLVFKVCVFRIRCLRVQKVCFVSMVPVDNILQNHVYLIHVKKYLKGINIILFVPWQTIAPFNCRWININKRFAEIVICDCISWKTEKLQGHLTNSKSLIRSFGLSYEIRPIWFIIYVEVLFSVIYM